MTAGGEWGGGEGRPLGLPAAVDGAAAAGADGGDDDAANTDSFVAGSSGSSFGFDVRGGGGVLIATNAQCVGEIYVGKERGE